MTTITLNDGRIVTVTESGHVYVFPPGSAKEVAGYSLTLPVIEPPSRTARRRMRRVILSTLQIR